MTAPSVMRKERLFLPSTFLICCFGVFGIQIRLRTNRGQNQIGSGAMSDSDADGSIDNLWQRYCLLILSCFSNMNDQRQRSPSLGKTPDSLPTSPLLARIQSIQKQQNLLDSLAKEENAFPDSLSVSRVTEWFIVARTLRYPSSDRTVRVSLV